MNKINGFGKVNDKIKDNSVGLFHIAVFLVVYLSNISYVTFGIITLCTYSDVVNGCKTVWIYNLIGIIYGASYIGKGAHIFTTSFNKAKSINEMTDINSSTYIDWIIIPILLVWGFNIMISIESDCIDFYLNGHRELWDLCQGTFYGILSMVAIFGSLELMTLYHKVTKAQNLNNYTFHTPDSLEERLIYDSSSEIVHV